MKNIIPFLIIPLSVLANINFCRVSDKSITYSPDCLVCDFPVTNIVWEFPEIPEMTEEEAEVYEYPEPTAHTNITYVKRTVMNPTRQQYFEHDWLLNTVEPAAVSNGYYSELSQYIAFTNAGIPQVRAEYRYFPVPEDVHTYKKSYLAQWFYANDKWESFQHALDGVPDARFLWSVCTEFDSDNSQWPIFLAYVKMSLSLSDDEVESMLAFGETGHE